MNFYTVLFVLAALSLSATEGEKKCCSNKDYTPVSSFNILGTWSTYLRYDNAQQKSAKCSYYEISRNETVPGAMVDWVTNIWEDNSKSCSKGHLTNTSSDLALFKIQWTDLTRVLTAVSSDFENYVILRSCYEEEEFLWIMVRTAKPSERVLQLIEAAIIELKLDEWKLRRS